MARLADSTACNIINPSNDMLLYSYLYNILKNSTGAMGVSISDNNAESVGRRDHPSEAQAVLE